VGFLQPLGRYDYRQTVNSIQTQSFRAAFQEGRFVRMDNLIVWTDFRDFAGRTLGETFILETHPDGSERFISAASGALQESRPGEFALQLENGNGATLAPPGQNDVPSTQALQFDSLVWPVDSQATPFRPRGKDERELTLLELADVSSFASVEQTAARAALHDLLSRAILVLVLPLLAVPLGLNLGRHPRAGGIVTGVVILLIVQKTLEYGLQMARTGAIPAWAGSWPVVILTALVGAMMFSRTAGTSILSVSRPREARNENLVLTPREMAG
jgi:lipopolysaccharide export system permease protein